MEKNTKKIKQTREELQNRLETEKSNMGGYENWWDSLSDFRSSLKGYITKINQTYKIHPCILSDGNLVDHHIISYLAPLDYKGRGFGGKVHTAAQQICELSNYFTKKGKRFIYVPLPNKGVIYPELITDVKCNQVWNSPQYRKYINEVLQLSEAIEIIDAFEILRDNKDHIVFAKGHHISSSGADILAQEIGKYLVETTPGIRDVGDIELYREDLLLKYYDWDYISHDHLYYENVIMNMKSPGEPFFSSTINSKIGVIGDCNLQHYQMFSGGLVSSLTYYTHVEIDEIGRYLPFDYVSPITQSTLSKLMEKEIIVYIAFASASYVRSRLLSRKRLGMPNPWCTQAL